MVYYPSEIEYSSKYYDNFYEYRHVILTKEIKKKLNGGLLSEKEWRDLGVVQSKGWEHYMIYKREPHVLLFRRPKGINPSTGEIPQDVKERIEEWERVRELYI
jgi:cyclin-dependent kinase regulatory subunit CKS1